MIRATKIDEVKANVREWKKAGLTIGLVPTMGYLHEGHASLIERARRECDKVIVSDFVNPIQFGPKEDLATYPRDFEADCKLCEGLGADLIFHPEPEEMYLDGFHSYVGVDTLSTELCGKSRPIHFNGVCTVVSKLFNITEADKAYFGEKDAQQLAIVKRMVRDLNFNIEIVCREPQAIRILRLNRKLVLSCIGIYNLSGSQTLLEFVFLVVCACLDREVDFIRRF